MIPLHKYSYSTYRRPLKFSSGAFLLLVDVTRLQVKLTAENAYQSKNQALRSKQQPVEIRNRFRQATHLGKRSEKNSASLKVDRIM